MDNKESSRDPSRLCDIVDNCRHIEERLAGVGIPVFLTDITLQAAVERWLYIICEASKNVSAERARHPNVDWKELTRLRERLAHHYSKTDLRKIYEMATKEIPHLRTDIETDPTLA
jgi:uncharacterized protein with HEPN domain